MITVATDSAEMYLSEVRKATRRYFGNRFDAVSAGETWGRWLGGASVDHVLELSYVDRRRVFNLGYFTWAEQQGVALEDFSVLRDSRFATGLLDLSPTWDAMIGEFNAKNGVAAALS